MFELLFALIVLLYTGFCFSAGVMTTVDVMRRDDADLYFEWMDRRAARKERR